MWFITILNLGNLELSFKSHTAISFAFICNLNVVVQLY